MGQRVLIVQSKAHAGYGVAPALEREGFAVMVAGDYGQGKKALETFLPDLVIIGSKVDGMDSWEMCSLLRQMCRVPIMKLGPEPSTEGWVKAVQFGADCYMRQLLSRLELLARIRSLIRRDKQNGQNGSGCMPVKSGNQIEEHLARNETQVADRG